MNLKVNRRRLLAIAGIGAVGVTLASLASWRTAHETDIVVATLRNRLKDLRIAPGIFEKFAKSYIETKDAYAKKMRLLGTFSELFSIMTPYNFLPMDHSWRRMEDNIVSNFLLSTDFFQNGANVSRQVNYLGLYDPYLRPCVQFFNENASG